MWYEGGEVMGTGDDTTKGPGQPQIGEDDSSTEATSRKTLSDIEETDKSSDSTNNDGRTPAPDGQFDEQKDDPMAGPV